MDTAPFVIKLKDKYFMVKGWTQVAGTEEDLGTHRCELSGILDAITYLNDVCKKFQVREGKVII